MQDSLVAFITAYQADPLHGPIQIRTVIRALELNESGTDKVVYYSSPNTAPLVLTIADGVAKFLGR